MTTPTDKFGVGESSNKNTVAFNNELSHGDKAVEASHRNNRMGSRKHPNPMGTITIPARKRRWRKNASPQFPKGNGDVSSPFGGLLPKNYGGGTSPVARSPIGSPDRNIDISTFFSRSPPIQHQGRGGGGGGRLLDANLPSQGEQNNPMNFLTSAAADAKNQEYKTPITYEMGALRPNSEHGSSGSTMERKRMDTKRGGNVSGPSSAQTMGRVNQRLPRQQQPAYIQPQHRMQFDSTRQRIHDMPLKQRPPIGQKLAFRQPPRIVEMRYQQQNDSGGGVEAGLPLLLCHKLTEEVSSSSSSRKIAFLAMSVGMTERCFMKGGFMLDLLLTTDLVTSQSNPGNGTSTLTVSRSSMGSSAFRSSSAVLIHPILFTPTQWRDS
mmetsp:Transcript_13853/g.22631  ORF Transcript_13853/g.22631 Transcript_13853/m.22631 type:complete len:380 (-) Transcript_13853:1619-2758(-)